ncbi:MAG: hypothetical protein H7Z10_10990 [Gemmatimonadaceae bacterium]|nr:hypothetical protein [Acetobacteraceae bacterium]
MDLLHGNRDDRPAMIRFEDRSPSLSPGAAWTERAMTLGGRLSYRWPGLHVVVLACATVLLTACAGFGDGSPTAAPTGITNSSGAGDAYLRSKGYGGSSGVLGTTRF